MLSNISTDASVSLAEMFKLLGQPIRMQIMLIVENDEACVCHIEAVLGIRQATISQHLMVLRDAGVVETNRDGRNIYYRIANPELLPAIYQIAKVAGVPVKDLEKLARRPVANCPCPRCNPDQDLGLSCDRVGKS